MFLEPLGIQYIILLSATGFLAFIDALYTRKYRLVYLVILYVLIILLTYDAIVGLSLVYRSASGILIFMVIVSLFVPILVYLAFFEYETLHPWITEHETTRFRRGILGLDILYYVFTVNPRAVVLTLSIPVITGVTFFFYASFLWILHDDAVLLSNHVLAYTAAKTLLVSVTIAPIVVVGLFVMGINTLWRLYGEAYAER